MDITRAHHVRSLHRVAHHHATHNAAIIKAAKELMPPLVDTVVSIPAPEGTHAP